MNKKISIMIAIFTILFLFYCTSNVWGSEIVIQDHWAKDVMNDFFEKHFVSDIPNWKPDEPIPVEEMAYTINRFFSFKEVEGMQENLEVAQQNGCFLNVTMGQMLSRQEVALNVCKLIGLEPEIDGQTSFQDDEDIATWAKDFLSVLQKKRIILGYPDLYFRPNQQITKAEFVTIIERCKDYAGQGLDIIADDKEVSNLEIGIFKYENGSVSISTIEDSIEMESGEEEYLSIALPPEFDSETKIQYKVQKEGIVEIAQDLLTITAIESGRTQITFYLDGSDLEKSFEIIVTD